MNCYVHTDISAVGVCVNCGRGVCAQCATAVGAKTYCRDCAASGAPLQQTGATNGLAIASLILGIISIPTLFCYGGGVLFGIAALITGFMARQKIKASGGAQTGDGLALAGIIMGGIVGVLIGSAVCVIVILALLGPAIGNVFSNIVLNV
jgi:hypothetical protein